MLSLLFPLPKGAPLLLLAAPKVQLDLSLLVALLWPPPAGPLQSDREWR